MDTTTKKQPPPSLPSASSSTSSTPRVGVADYFAILGVGQDLVWKHAAVHQKATATASQRDGGTDDGTNAAASSSDATNGDNPQDDQDASAASDSRLRSLHPEEDDTMLMERFYREIVDCDIVIVGGEGRHRHEDHHQQQQHRRQSHHENWSQYDNQPQHSSLVTSSPSWDQSTVDSDANTSALEVTALEREGWTIIQKTRPASTTTNSSSHPSSTTRTPWKRGQVWDANLDVLGGLPVHALTTTSAPPEDENRKQQRQGQHDLDQLSLSSSSSWLHNQRAKGGVIGQGASLVRSNVTSPLKDLRQKVQSTLQSTTVIQQFLHRTRSQEEDGISHLNSSSSNLSPLQKEQLLQTRPPLQKYFLAYKRRTPDQPNLPAVADVALYYVQIHTMTITTFSTTNDDQGDNVSPPHLWSRPLELQSMLDLPAGFEEWVIPRPYKQLKFPRKPFWLKANNENVEGNGSDVGKMGRHHSAPPITTTTVLFPASGTGTYQRGAYPSQGIEAVDRTPPRQAYKGTTCGSQGGVSTTNLIGPSNSYSNWRERMRPRLLEPDNKILMKLAASTASNTVSSRRNNTGKRQNYQPFQNQQTDERVVITSSSTNNIGGECSASSSFDSNHNCDILDRNGNETARWKNIGDQDDYGMEYIFVPVLAIRRQRTGEEERFAEDPALVDISVSFLSRDGLAIMPTDEYMYQHHQNVSETGDDDGCEEANDDDDDNIGRKLLRKTKWRQSGTETGQKGGFLGHPIQERKEQQLHRKRPTIGRSSFGAVCLLTRHNIPMGFCDAAFSTSVLDRFPYKNYKGLPLPEEELPMFCYPTGCRLYRAKYCDAPLPQYYGFVVKNERGDSIYVSCVSFMEPLTSKKKEQLAKLSEKRRRVSLPHKKFCARQRLRRKQLHRQRQFQQTTAIERNNRISMEDDERLSGISVASPSDWIDVSQLESTYQDDEDGVLTPFDQMTTFENKTICILSRYPFWTAFRRFLSHLHSISGSCADVPLERYISHLLLCVPVPKAGGPSILIPLPSFNVPLMLCTPPQKDLPLIDLPFERLLACLDVPTIVTLVLGLLCLEQKVIVMSTRPSLVLDACELLRSLLFPFELVAPYVPRLTEPFMSCLEFPGAIFVGIHDDGVSDGLAAIVRREMPEDSTIINLDTGSVDCHGDRLTVLNNSWGVIPAGPRSVLVSEIETLCRDASIVPGQEPLDSQLDPAFEASIPTPTTMVEDDIVLSNPEREVLDDRAIRDAFLRFFCSILAGYERYLVVPDVDFLISGNEWFDAKGFLASASEENAAYLGSLVSTQLFQSFIQRRTEASDVHLLLFDECMQEYHSSTIPYGRLGGDVETVRDNEGGKSMLLYSLLVDQSATEHPALFHDRSFDGDSKGLGSDTDNSSGQYVPKGPNSDASDCLIRFSEFGINSSGDWVTVPSRQGIPEGARFIYCVDGSPTFPDSLNPSSFLPREPESWLVEISTESTPMLTRSGKEIEEADRRRKFATSYRGLHSQRKCLWQLPKLMGSHFLGTWLLCLPALVSQSHLSHEQQSKYLLRALGALRILRNKHKIVPDEAAYRALIVACGRTKNDRRTELVKLFGLLRSDGIFPSAVTLGQYTRALAEGYSKRAIGPADEDHLEESASLYMSRIDVLFDPNLALLEDSGRRWRQKTNGEEGVVSDDVHKADEKQKKRSHNKPWFPVVLSSSFVPSRAEDFLRKKESHSRMSDLKLTALWSRTVACGECSYIPLDEEIQGGWDAVYGSDHDIPGAIACPRCGCLLVPKLAFKVMSLDEALHGLDPNDGLPPQLRPDAPRGDENFVTYLNPSALRKGIEQAVDEHGETILDREKLRVNYAELFYNLWWLCARFQMPLPLAIGRDEDDDSCHYIAVAAW